MQQWSCKGSEAIIAGARVIILNDEGHASVDHHRITKPPPHRGPIHRVLAGEDETNSCFAGTSPETVNTPSIGLHLAFFVFSFSIGELHRERPEISSKATEVTICHHLASFAGEHHRKSESHPEAKPSHTQSIYQRTPRTKYPDRDQKAETIHRRLEPNVYLYLDGTTPESKADRSPKEKLSLLILKGTLALNLNAKKTEEEAPYFVKAEKYKVDYKNMKDYNKYLI
ncbi:Uncharacterized protein Rs2_04258 [Raphanus sativus]|nr:Uncharacterized protein Rs2_04258 [Raphanus sativus]